MFGERKRVAAEGNGDVLTCVKTPAFERPTTATLPSHCTLKESVELLLRQPPATDEDRRLREQLRREIAGHHNFFAITDHGVAQRVTANTRLREIAAPRELRTRDGEIKKVEVAAFEVQRYAEVGLVAPRSVVTT